MYRAQRWPNKRVFFPNFLLAQTSLTQLLSLDLLTRRSPARQLFNPALYNVSHCLILAFSAILKSLLSKKSSHVVSLFIQNNTS